MEQDVTENISAYDGIHKRYNIFSYYQIVYVENRSCKDLSTSDRLPWTVTRNGVKKIKMSAAEKDQLAGSSKEIQSWKP